MLPPSTWECPFSYHPIKTSLLSASTKCCSLVRLSFSDQSSVFLFSYLHWILSPLLFSLNTCSFRMQISQYNFWVQRVNLILLTILESYHWKKGIGTNLRQEWIQRLKLPVSICLILGVLGGVQLYFHFLNKAIGNKAASSSSLMLLILWLDEAKRSFCLAHLKTIPDPADSTWIFTLSLDWPSWPKGLEYDWQPHQNIMESGRGKGQGRGVLLKEEKKAAG